MNAVFARLLSRQSTIYVCATMYLLFFVQVGKGEEPGLSLSTSMRIIDCTAYLDVSAPHLENGLKEFSLTYDHKSKLMDEHVSRSKIQDVAYRAFYLDQGIEERRAERSRERNKADWERNINAIIERKGKKNFVIFHYGKLESCEFIMNKFVIYFNKKKGEDWLSLRRLDHWHRIMEFFQELSRKQG